MPNLRSSREPSTIVLVVGGRVDRAHIRALCERARGLLEGDDRNLIVCDVGAVFDPDAATIDALARLQLTARELGGRIQLQHACDELQELLELTGLSDVLPLCAELPLEPRRQAEEREQARRIEEESDPADPST